jgi:hypothetical protein
MEKIVMVFKRMGFVVLWEILGGDMKNLIGG